MVDEQDNEQENEDVDETTEGGEKKTRQRLTVTAMQEAISDLVFTVRIKPEDARTLGPCGFSYWKKAGGKTVCQVHAMDDDADEHDHSALGNVILAMVAEGGVEEATAVVLDQMKTEFEEYRARMVKSLDAVIERHHGALRGARSKIREKKA